MEIVSLGVYRAVNLNDRVYLMGTISALICSIGICNHVSNSCRICSIYLDGRIDMEIVSRMNLVVIVSD